MSMTFSGCILDGKLNLPSAQKALRESYLSSMPSGTLIEETIKKISPKKTHKQVKAIFGLCLTMIIQTFSDNGWDSSILLKLPTPTGNAVSKNLLKEYLYAVCPINDDEGNKITLSAATIEQAGKFIDEIRNFAASQWGIAIPEPDINWRGAAQKQSRSVVDRKEIK